MTTLLALNGFKTAKNVRYSSNANENNNCAAKNHQNNAVNNPFNNTYSNFAQNSRQKLAFGGGLDFAVKTLKMFNDKPMIGVAFTDTAATNAPRTVGDFAALGPAAGAETMRREFSGLIVNCLIPSFFALGAAKLINGHFMKDFKGVNMSSSWAGSETIDVLTKAYKNSINNNATEKEEIQTFVKQTLGSLEGLKEKKWIDYGAILDSDNGKKAAELITDAISSPAMGKKETKNSIKKALKILAAETGAVETIRFKNTDKNFGSNLADLLRDQVDLGRKFTQGSVKNNLDKFAAAAKKMVNTKSAMALSVIVPLAMSMQYINRAITRHKYKKTGAPIYKDFEKEDRTLTPEEQKKLNKQKPLCVASMVGLALLSMMKKPSLEMFQFRGMFPTLDQCRWIATGTFASRMMSSEDSNELRDSTIRDLASFSGLYFLGDYASKATATLIEKCDKDAKLLNHTKDLPENAGILKKFGNWVKNTKVKSFDEVAKNTKATKYRAVCEIASLAFSIVTLGVLLPMYNRKVTAKKDAERKARMQEEQNKINQMAAQKGSTAQNGLQNMLVHPMKDTLLSKNDNVSILNGTKVKDLEVTTFNVEKSKNQNYYHFEMKGKFKDWKDYTQDDVFREVATECFK